jgi:hypothetical protein
MGNAPPAVNLLAEIQDIAFTQFASTKREPTKPIDGNAALKQTILI